VRVQATPTLVDRGESVDLELLDDPQAAAVQHRYGVIRLARLAAAKQCRLIKRDLPQFKSFAVMRLPTAPVTALPDRERQRTIEQDNEPALLADLLTALIDTHIATPVRDEGAFEALVVTLRSQLMADAVALWEDLKPALSRLASVNKRLSKNIGLDWMAAIEDIRDQLAHLVYAGFIGEHGYSRSLARNLDRYLAAIEQRLDKLARDGASADKQRMREILPYWQAYKQRAERAAGKPQRPDGLHELRWMIEEYRVQVYAQPLGTAMKVSAKRLDAALAELR
jgi:ATP-dependent helicase HrpA